MASSDVAAPAVEAAIKLEDLPPSPTRGSEDAARTRGHRRLDSASALLPSPSTSADLEDPLRRRRRRLVPTGFEEWTSRNAGFLLIAISQLGMALMNAFVAMLQLLTPERVETWEIIWVRMLVTGVGCVAYMRHKGVADPVWGPKEVRGLLVVRGFCGFFGLFGAYYSLRYLSLSDTTVLTFLGPMLSSVLAVPVLGETFTSLERNTSLASLLGVVLIAKPEAVFGAHRPAPSEDVRDPLADVTPHQRLVAVGASMVGVCGAAGAYVTIRKIGPRADALHSIAYFSMSCFIITTSYALVSRSPPVVPHSSKFAGLLLLVGVFGFVAQWLLTMGIQRVKMGKGTAAIYLHVVFAIGLQKLVFGTSPDGWSLLGSSIIIGGALLVALRKETSDRTQSAAWDAEAESDDGARPGGTTGKESTKARDGPLDAESGKSHE